MGRGEREGRGGEGSGGRRRAEVGSAANKGARCGRMETGGSRRVDGGRRLMLEEGERKAGEKKRGAWAEERGRRR